MNVAATTPLVDEVMVREALSVLVEPGQVFEIRILNPRRDGRGYMPHVISGYFDNPTMVPEALMALQLEGAKGIYITLNPIAPALLARSHNKFTAAKDGQTTSDKDILRRKWFLVDCDPKRPAGISASDEEKENAHGRAREIYGYLHDAGWPEPVAADSGNGYHLLYRLDQGTNTETVKSCLEALDKRFDDLGVSIDTSVFNPSRIVKMYGTRAEKGDHCPDLGRPHRLSKLLRVPEQIEAVPLEKIDALAAEISHPSKLPFPTAEQSKGAPEGSCRHPWDREKAQEFIDRHLAVCRPGPATPYNGGYKWVLGICPFNPDHSDRSAVIVIKADGKLGFMCHHNGCKENNWKALRAKFEAKDEYRHRQESNVVAEDEGLVAQYGSFISWKNGAPTDFNQMFLAGRYGRDNLVLYEPALHMFYSYDAPTGLWKPETEDRMRIELGHALRRILGEYGCECLMKKRTESTLSQIVRLLKGIIEKADVFVGKDPIIHVGNGVLDLSITPPTLRGFSPEHYSRNRSEISVNAQAGCPRFIDELLRPALSEDDISLIQRYAGQCLLGRNLSQKILLLRGTPGGGKSTLANILETVIGHHNVAQLRVHLLGERFEIAAFVGKTLLSGKDVPGNFLNANSVYMLKALVGGDKLDAEQKNVKNRFEVRGDFNVMITSNTRLHVRLDADSGAWQRRLLIVDYNQPPVAKPIPKFDRLLIDTEGPGILNWCIEGAIRLLAELEAHGRIQLTEEQIRRVDALLCESDSVRSFIGDCTVRDDSADVTVNELQTAYLNFCDDQGWQPVTLRQFENQVSDIMMEIHRVPKRTDIKRHEKNQRGFAHVAIQKG